MKVFSNKQLLQTLLLVLGLEILCFGISGCSSTHIEQLRPQVVESDTEWYDSRTISLTDMELSCDGSQIVYVDERCSIFNKHSNGSADEQYFTHLVYVDENNAAYEFDLDEHFENISMLRFSDCMCIDDQHYAVVNCTELGVTNTYICQIDIENMCLIDRVVLSIDSSYNGATIDKVRYSNEKYYVEFSYLVNNYYKDAFAIYEEDAGFTHYYCIEEGVIMLWSFDDDGSLLTINYNNAANEDSCYSLVDINVETGDSDLISNDVDLLTRYGLLYVSEEGKLFQISKDFKLQCLDLKTGEESTVLDFNNCSANLNTVQNSSIVYCDESTIILSQDTYYPNEDYVWNLTRLERAESNPNVGKQIIYAAPYTSVDSLSAYAIEQYNSQSTDSCIHITMDYSVRVFDDYEHIADYTSNTYNKDLAILSTLKQDIRNGVGPDILLGFSYFDAINHDEYLMDLFSVINNPDTFNRDEYFSNIFDAYVQDGKLYQMPLCVALVGLYVYDDEMWTDQYGMTFDNYYDYVANVSNGFNPIENEMGRTNAFDFLIRSHYNELHTEDGLLSLDNDTFRDICALVKDMNPESTLDVFSRYGRFVEFNRLPFDLTRMLISSDKVLVGLPTEDGSSGPVASAFQSVAITSCTKDFDAAFAYVNSLLSYDAQLHNVTYNPINRAAFEQYSIQSLEYADNYMRNMYGFEDYSFDGYIEMYESYIMSANTSNMCDAYSLMILDEEMQAYYCDQKSLDEIIDIVENRANTMLEENH